MIKKDETIKKYLNSLRRMSGKEHAKGVAINQEHVVAAQIKKTPI